jgi:hypothetical protein
MQKEVSPSSHKVVREYLWRKRQAGFEYVDYDGLYDLLGKSKGASRAVAFRAALDKDMERVRHSMLAMMGLLRARVSGSSNSSIGVGSGSTALQKDLAESFARLETAVNVNIYAIDQLLQRHDRVVSGSVPALRARALRRLCCEWEWVRDDFPKTFIALAPFATASVVSPVVDDARFPRASTWQYFVRPEDLPRIGRVVQLHEPSRTSSSRSLSRLYLDNAQLECYRRLLAREPGAVLVSLSPVPVSPTMDESTAPGGVAAADVSVLDEVLLELFVTGTARALAPASSLRLRTCVVDDLLRGLYTADMHAAELSAAGRPYAEVQEARRVMSEVCGLLARKQLRPALRVKAREEVLELGGLSLSLWSEFSVTRLDGGTTAGFGAAGAHGVTPGEREDRLGHGVVEVRVVSEAVRPDWLTTLLRSDRIAPVDNWSPFLQGCVSTHELAVMLSERPDWAAGAVLGRAPVAGRGKDLAGALSAATARASRALVSFSLRGGGRHNTKAVKPSAGSSPGRKDAALLMLNPDVINHMSL